VVDKYGGKMDIITADGGFDFSIDFDNQEINMTALLFAQVSYGLYSKEKRYIHKIFDAFLNNTINILALLSSFYRTVYNKPSTSRYANPKNMSCVKVLALVERRVLPSFKTRPSKNHSHKQRRRRRVYTRSSVY
jgi:hypothetical protein